MNIMSCLKDKKACRMILFGLIMLVVIADQVLYTRSSPYAHLAGGLLCVLASLIAWAFGLRSGLLIWAAILVVNGLYIFARIPRTAEVFAYYLVSSFSILAAALISGWIRNLHDRLAEEVRRRTEAERMLTESEKLHRTVFAEAAAGLAIVRLDGTIVTGNQMAEKISGYSSAQIAGQRWASLVHPDDLREKLHGGNIDPHRELPAREVRIFTASGEIRYISARITPIPETELAVVAFSDLTDHYYMEAELRYLSEHDPLTGLYNRRLYNRAIEKFRQQPGLPVSVIAIDLDNFKQFNDLFGHLAGDERLREVAELLRDSFRSTDLIARIGGDEFVVLLPDTCEESAMHAVNRLKQRILQYNCGRDGPPLGMSIGVTSCSAAEIMVGIASADAGMYVDKFSHKQACEAAGEPAHRMPVLD